MFLAKALYDNIAESPDELAFRRGDVLTVMQQDTSGLDGWWLCSLRGRQGIAPGNRLKILSGMGGTVPGPQSEQDIARNEWRRSAETSPNKVRCFPLEPVVLVTIFISWTKAKISHFVRLQCLLT